MKEENLQNAYSTLFNAITDVEELLQEARDDGIVMEVVPEYTPVPKKKGGKEKE